MNSRSNITLSEIFKKEKIIVEGSNHSAIQETIFAETLENSTLGNLAKKISKIANITKSLDSLFLELGKVNFQ